MDIKHKRYYDFSISNNVYLLMFYTRPVYSLNRYAHQLMAINKGCHFPNEEKFINAILL